MKRLTISLEQRHVYELDARQRINDLGSRSAAARDVLDSYEEVEQEYEDLEQEYEDLHKSYEEREDRIETLESQLRERSQIEKKIEDLPDKVRSVETYSERRQRLLDSASLAERLRWKLTGVPVDRLQEDSD